MPMYEYHCEACEHQFETMQSLHSIPQDTVCPKCAAKKSRRLLSAFASKIVGEHKTGFAEQKAYNMLNQRMDKFGKLPPMFGKRALPTPPASDASSQGGNGAE